MLEIAMEVVGFGVGVVAEARTVAQSIVRRVEIFRQGRKSFKAVSDSLSHLMCNIAEVDRLTKEFPRALPEDVSALFDSTLNRVRDELNDVDAAVEKNFSKPFAGSSSSFLGALKSKGYRVFRANALTSKMNVVERRIKEVSNELLQLIIMFSNALKLDSLNVAESLKEEHRPVVCAPAVSHSVYLDFESRTWKENSLLLRDL